MNRTFQIVSTALFLCLWNDAAHADQPVSGTVHNLTTSRPASGDDVILLKLGNGMEEQARTKTDPQGVFTLAGRAEKTNYVVRVMHQGVNYDQTVIGTGALDINVVDAVSHIPGLSGSIGMVQMETDEHTVHVIEMYGITNASNPPVTQASPRNFTIALPQGATFDSVEAKRAEGVWVKIRPTPIAGQARGYAVDFPIRPGDTLYKVSYHLPYAGRTRFQLKVPYPIKKFAVMHPPSISFRASRKDAYVTAGGQELANGFQIEKAISEPLTGDVPTFEISGVGAVLPPVAAKSISPAQKSSVAPSAPAGTRAPSASSPGDSTLGKDGTAGPSKLLLWLAVFTIAALLFAGVWLVLRKRRRRSVARQPKPLLVEAIKQELFQLEVDRAQGAISAEDYAATKQALNQTLERSIEKATANS